MRSVLVVPTYQEAENIQPFLRAVREVVPDLEIIVADDNSPDGTGKYAEVVGDELGGIEVLHRPGKEGLGAAYRHGFRHALDRGFDVIVQMDADFSHDPAVLPELLGAVESGADVAIGSRYVPGGNVPNWTWFRRGLSRYGNEFARWALHLAVRDADLGLPCLHRRDHGGHRHRRDDRQRLPVPDRDRVPVDGGGRAHGRTPDLLRRPQVRDVEDGGRPHHGRDPGAGDLVGPVHACAGSHGSVPSNTARPLPRVEGAAEGRSGGHLTAWRRRSSSPT